MRRIILVASLAALAVLAGCAFYPSIVGSGTPTSLSYDSVDFTGIDASSSFTVHVVPDTEYSLTVTCDSNLTPYLKVGLSGSTLILGLMEGYWYQNTTLSAEVHMPSLDSLDASGASIVTVDSGFGSMPSLSVELSGASSCQASDVTCTTLSVDVSGVSTLTLTCSADSVTGDISGASFLTLSGDADAISCSVSGASSVDLLSCPTALAVLDVSGASKCWVDVPAGIISAEVSGASTLYYSGSPSFSVLDVSGASQLVKVD